MNNVAEIIQNYLDTTDQSLTEDQLIVLAKKSGSQCGIGKFTWVMR